MLDPSLKRGEKGGVTADERLIIKGKEGISFRARKEKREREGSSIVVLEKGKKALRG